MMRNDEDFDLDFESNPSKKDSFKKIRQDDSLKLVGLLRKYLLMIVVLPIFCGLMGWFIAKSLPSTYTSAITVMIGQDSSKATGGIGAMLSLGGDSGDSFQAQIEVLKSKAVMVKLVKELRLWELPEFNPRQGKTSVIKTIKAWLGDVEVEKKLTEDDLANIIAPSISEQLEIEPLATNKVVKISFTSKNPYVSATVLNKLIDVYVTEDKIHRYEQAKQMSGSLKDKAIKELYQKVLDSQSALQAYKEKHNLINVKGEMDRAGAMPKVEQLTTRVIEASSKLAQLESTINQIKLRKSNDYYSIPEVMSYGSVPDARAKEATAKLKVAELSEKYGYEHPLMLQAKAELAAAHENLNGQIRTAVEAIFSEYQANRATLNALKQSLAEERGEAQRENKASFGMLQLQQELEANQLLYENYMKEVKKVDLVADASMADETQNVARVIDKASPPQTPSGPKKSKIILAAFVLGLFAALGIASLIEMTDRTVKGSNDAEDKFNIPVLSSIPDLKFEGGAGPVELAFMKDPNSYFAESVRTARTSLILSDLSSAHKVFLVTSATVEEGKTSTSCNLALSLAESYKTLLLEADLRRPRIAKIFGLAKPARDLFEAIKGGAHLSEITQKIEGSKLDVISYTGPQCNPLEIFSSKDFEVFIERLKSEYEYIVIDSPPLEAVSDALVLSRLVGNVLFVIRAHSTSGSAIESSLIKLNRAKTKILGLILNRVNMKAANQYYGEYHGHSKYYGTYLTPRPKND